MLSSDQNFVQWFFHRTVVLVLLFSAPLSPARSFTNKVYPDVRDVRQDRSAFFERRRERDAIVSREDCDRPAEGTRERERDLAIASAQRYAERWTRVAFQSPVRGRRVVLFSCVPYINIVLISFHRNEGRHWDRRRRTTVAWRKPLSVHESKETRFDIALPSWMSHISAVMGPLVV